MHGDDSDVLSTAMCSALFRSCMLVFRIPHIHVSTAMHAFCLASMHACTQHNLAAKCCFDLDQIHDSRRHWISMRANFFVLLLSSACCFLSKIKKPSGDMLRTHTISCTSLAGGGHRELWGHMRPTRAMQKAGLSTAITEKPGLQGIFGGFVLLFAISSLEQGHASTSRHHEA